MTPLAITSVLLGLVIVMARLPGVIAPAWFRDQALRFPRSMWAGRILMGIVAIWAGIVIYRAAADNWAWARPLIVLGIPLAYWLVIQFAHQFLAVRGAAAVVLLVSKVMLDAVDVSDVPVRLIVTVFVYALVVVAIWMIIAPHQFRDVAGFSLANDSRCRAVCSAGLALGVVFVALGIFVY